MFACRASYRDPCLPQTQRFTDKLIPCSSAYSIRCQTTHTPPFQFDLSGKCTKYYGRMSGTYLLDLQNNEAPPLKRSSPRAALGSAKATMWISLAQRFEAKDEETLPQCSCNCASSTIVFYENDVETFTFEAWLKIAQNLVVGYRICVRSRQSLRSTNHFLAFLFEEFRRPVEFEKQQTTATFGEYWPRSK